MRQEFSLQEVLLLHLDTVRSGQRIVGAVHNTAADASANTLACYKLTR